MSECEFNQEGFCIAEEKCSAKEKQGKCTAKNEDLIELCSDCYEPIEDCDCGTCWVLVENIQGKIVAITPREYKKTLREMEK